MRSDQVRGSRYSSGGVSDVKADTIGWWERVVLPKSDSDINVLITAKYHMRPDIMAYELYGTASLMWLVLQYANVVDVSEDFVRGTEIRLPTKTRLMSELLGRKK